MAKKTVVARLLGIDRVSLWLKLKIMHGGIAALIIMPIVAHAATNYQKLIPFI
jgi:hypothetical protein